MRIAGLVFGMVGGAFGATLVAYFWSWFEAWQGSVLLVAAAAAALGAVLVLGRFGAGGGALFASAAVFGVMALVLDAWRDELLRIGALVLVGAVLAAAGQARSRREAPRAATEPLPDGRWPVVGEVARPGLDRRQSAFAVGLFGAILGVATHFSPIGFLWALEGEFSILKLQLEFLGEEVADVRLLACVAGLIGALIGMERPGVAAALHLGAAAVWTPFALSEDQALFVAVPVLFALAGVLTFIEAGNGFAALGRLRTRQVASVLVAAVVTTAVGLPALGAAQADTGIVGDTYTSPTYGYRLSWDAASWTVSSEEVDRDGWDILRLQYGETGFLYVEGYAGYDGDPADCLAGIYEDEFADLPDILPATRGDEPLAGSDDGVAFDAYSYIGYHQDREIVRVAFVSCHTLVPGESVVAFTLVSTEEAFFADLEAAEEVIASLELPDGGERSGSTRASQDEPDETDAEGGVYESPLYGYTLAYDPEEWEVAFEDDNPDDPYDRVFLFNGTSMVGLTGDPTYDQDDLADCVDNYVRVFETGEGISDVEPLDERGADGDDDDRAWATFAYVYTNEDGDETDNVVSFECRWLGDDQTLVVYHNAPAEAYDDEIDVRDALLEGFAPAGEAADRGDDDDEPVRQPAGGEVYESPTYGYTLTYDPTEWSIGSMADRDNPGDEAFFTHVRHVGVVAVIGDPNYGDDELGECVADNGAFADRDNVDIEPLDDRGADGEEDDRVWATYSYEYTGESPRPQGGYVRYVECRWLGEGRDGVAVVILHDAPAAAYEDQIEVREAFLAGLEPADVGPEGDREDGDQTGPALVDGAYQLPRDEDAVVVEAIVNNGSLPPEYQAGYDIEIDASGRADATVYPEGSLAEGDEPTAEVEEIATDLGEDGLQELLAELDELGFFALPQEELGDVDDGGYVSVVVVRLAGDTWTVNAASLETAEQGEVFAAALATIEDAVGVDRPAL